MTNTNNAVMPSLKGSRLVNVVPTKDNVDYDRIYYYNNLELVVNTFTFFEDNREHNKSHISEIQKYIEEGEYRGKYIMPLRVDINTMGIADGQHRIEAFVNAWKNGSIEAFRVIYEDLPTDERKRMSLISLINTTNKNWTINDHQHRLLTEENKSMLSVADFGKTHRLCQKVNKKGEVTGFYPRYVYGILAGKNLTNNVKDGTIKITKKELEFGEMIYGELEKLVDALGYDINSWFESFAYSWWNLRKEDKSYSGMVEKHGIDIIANHIHDYFANYHPVTRKSEWDKRFRSALYDIDNDIKTKRISA